MSISDWPIFALTTRGLENVSADEVASISAVRVTDVGYRRIAATCASGLGALLDLRTVDDVFLDVGTWSGVGRHRDELGALGRRAVLLRLAEAAGAVRGVRTLPDRPRFAVTASFVGRRNYSSGEISGAVGQAVSAALEWPYSERDSEAELNVRLFIEHETAYVGVRLGRSPLHRRAYKVAHVPGSLKPPVAAALLRLAQADSSALVVDPCCGAGTIVIEASLAGASAAGGDISAEATRAANTNADRAGIAPSISLWDAQELPLGNGCVDAIVSNLPWGREVEVEASLPALYGRLLAEVERVLTKRGRAVVLTDAPQHVRAKGLKVKDQIEISLFGRMPVAVVLSSEAD